jgi:hypothetical protein
MSATRSSRPTGASIAGLLAGEVNWAEVGGEILKTLSAKDQAEW